MKHLFYFVLLIIVAPFAYAQESESPQSTHLFIPEKMIVGQVYQETVRYLK